MNNIQIASELGQSLWLDYIRRSFITSGELSEIIDMGITGMTSNPTIFQKAITGSSDYDSSLVTLMEEGHSPWEIYDELTREDIAMAADLLMPVYENTAGRDGYVSLEVSPDLAHDTEGTVREGVRLFTSLNRPNIMIKVPATAEGIPAIEQLILRGVNVNVTLIFSIQQYRAAAQSYIEGIRKRSAEGRSVDTIASVASFFVSRLDTAVDHLLHDSGNSELKGQAAIANVKLAYGDFGRIFAGRDWKRLEQSGARLQRPLWASTSTKNPAYPDTLYVDSLIGRNTVNTLPMETLHSFLDHGKPSLSLAENLEQASLHMERIADIGIDIDRVTRDLLEQGVKSFADSFISLINGIRQKTESLGSGRTSFLVHTAGYGDIVDKTLKNLKEHHVMGRLWDHDYTLWKDDPKDISDRLGWLSSPVNMKGVVGQIHSTVGDVLSDGYTDALLMGMGGSSLAPDLFQKTLGVMEGFLDLNVIDSTDPAAVLEAAERSDPSKCLFVVSSKSGTTTETLSHLKYFFNQTTEAVGSDRAGQHFIAITDPGSPLASLASKLGFREIFLNDPDIGGRYSALSYFGLVPAALMGINIELLLDRAAAMASNCEPANCPVEGDNTCAVLGSVMGAMHDTGIDKLTFITSPSITPLGTWLEQLLAESTGKEGKGIVPVNGEFPENTEFYGPDRLFVYLRISGDNTFDRHVKAFQDADHPVVSIQLSDHYDIGAEFFRWEVGTAIAGHVMGINPFDQPNVESAKERTRRLLQQYQEKGSLPKAEPMLVESGVEVYADISSDNLGDAMGTFLGQVQPGDYVALQAYIHPTSEASRELEELRHRIRNIHKVATTLGFGPRYLHSTGQLHKGGSGKGLFIQITVDDPLDLPIPDEAGNEGSSITFGVLKAAQAMGDLQALQDAGRRVIRFHIKGNVTEGIETLIGTLV